MCGGNQESASVEDQWKRVCSALVDAGKENLGYASRRQPDWFLDSQDVLAPILNELRHLYNNWIRSQSPRDHTLFKAARSKARAEVRRAKCRWFASIAEQADLGRKTFHGASVWSAIRTIQHNHRGHTPTVTPSIRDEEGNLCCSSEEQLQRWHRHFTKVLNIQSDFDPSVFDQLSHRPVQEWPGDLPSMDEVLVAVRRLRNRKAAGCSGILPEMVKCAGEDLYNALLVLVHRIWEDGWIPQAWRDASLVSISKKGDLSMCDNWRGISLLDVVGKVMGRLLQDRLQAVAKQELPDSQCGFGRGQSCTDQIFSLLQITEKLYEHQHTGFLIFIDLRKA